MHSTRLQQRPAKGSLTKSDLSKTGFGKKTLRWMRNKRTLIRWYLRNRHRASIISGLEILDIFGKIHPPPPILRSTKGVSDESTTTDHHGPQVPIRLRCRRAQ